MGYGSDADVMFVHDPLPGVAEADAARAADAVAQELRRMLALPGPDPALVVDANLRPEGRQGPLVRTLASYLAYYRRWSRPWEAQALLRAEPVAGDASLGAEFTRVIDEFRYPDGGVGDQAVREIRRIKARMEGERMPRGVEPALQVKLGPGGLSDVEWTVQLLQLRHVFAVPALRTTRTLPALAAERQAALIAPADAAVLAESWQLAARTRDAVCNAGPRYRLGHDPGRGPRTGRGGPPPRLRPGRGAGPGAGLPQGRPARPRRHGPPSTANPPALPGPPSHAGSPC